MKVFYAILPILMFSMGWIITLLVLFSGEVLLFLREIGIVLVTIALGVPVGTILGLLLVAAALVAAVVFGLLSLFSRSFRAWCRDEFYGSRYRIAHFFWRW